MKSLGRVQNFMFSGEKNTQNLEFLSLIFYIKHKILGARLDQRNKTFRTNFWVCNVLKESHTKIPLNNSLPNNHIFFYFSVFIYLKQQPQKFYLFLIISQKWMDFIEKRRTESLLLFNPWRILILFFPTKLVNKHEKYIILLAHIKVKIKAIRQHFHLLKW